MILDRSVPVRGLLEGVTAPDSRARSVLPLRACCGFYIAGKFPTDIVWFHEKNVKRKEAGPQFFFCAAFV